MSWQQISRLQIIQKKEEDKCCQCGYVVTEDNEKEKQCAHVSLLVGAECFVNISVCQVNANVGNLENWLVNVNQFVV